MTLIEAARQALHALDDARHHMSAMGTTTEPQIAAQDALRTALTEAEQSPGDRARAHADRICGAAEAESSSSEAGNVKQEPFGYVITNNVPEGSPYRHIFYKPDEINTAYKDNALYSTPVYAAQAQPVAVPAGWELEHGTAGFDYTRWICIRNLESQCGQDFYEDRDPLIFGFLRAMLAASPAAPAQVPQPLTPGELADKCEAWLQADGRTASNVVDAYEAGYRDCERAHGITGDKS